MKDKLQLLLDYLFDKSNEIKHKEKNIVILSEKNRDDLLRFSAQLQIIDEIIKEAHSIQNRSIEERLTLLETKFYEQFGE